MVRAEFDGEGAPELVAEKTTLEVEAGAYQVRFDGEVADRGRFEVTEASGAVVLRGEHGPNAGRTIPGIYQQVGDRLRICFGLSGVTPDGFKSIPGQMHYLVTYRRVATD